MSNYRELFDEGDLYFRCPMGKKANMLLSIHRNSVECRFSSTSTPRCDRYRSATSLEFQDRLMYVLAVRVSWREELLRDDAIEVSGCTGAEDADASSDIRDRWH